jgi:Tfp pilus assembly protein PilV
VQAGLAKIDISCTGTTKAGGAAALTGTTNELPGASVVSLNGQFAGTVDGSTVFSTQRLGG